MSAEQTNASRSLREQQLTTWIKGESFSCLAAKAAVRRNTARLLPVGSLAELVTSAELHSALVEFVASDLGPTENFATAIAIFDGPLDISETSFDELLWRQLSQLHELDIEKGYSWANGFDSDPNSLNFAFSIVGHPFFAVGMCPSASRLSRRFPFPALAFNSHHQFRRLKERGTYQGLQKRIREREYHLQNSLNPNLADFGQSSEARQYAGIRTDREWRCPVSFRPPSRSRGSAMKSIPTTASAVVTGASSGFGAAIARHLAQEGRPVVAIARRKDRLDDLAEGCEADLILPISLDVRDPDAVAEAMRNLPPRFADVGVLVNNAGLSKGFGPLQEADLGHWREMVDTNVMGTLHCVRAVLPSFLAAGRGHVINIGSVAATYPYMGGNVYGGTKAFVHQLSLNLRTDLEGSGIRVSCIAPGMARTEFATVRFDGDQARADALYADIDPLTPVDIAEAVLWCISQPSHVNVNLIELMPVRQQFGLGLRVPTTA